MNWLGILCLGFALSFQAAHATAIIFDSRKPIAMDNNEVTQKDYYINAGTEAGLAPGIVVTVVRQVPLYDTFQNHSAGNLSVKVAKVKIIYAQKGLSVARYVSGFSREDNPVIQDDFVMVGDRLDLSSAHKEAAAKTSQASARSTASVKPPAAKIKVNTVEVSMAPPKPAVKAPVLR